MSFRIWLLILTGKLVVGNVFKEFDEWNAEEQVKEYLENKDH